MLQTPWWGKKVDSSSPPVCTIRIVHFEKAFGGGNLARRSHQIRTIPPLNYEKAGPIQNFAEQPWDPIEGGNQVRTQAVPEEFMKTILIRGTGDIIRGPLFSKPWRATLGGNNAEKKIMARRTNEHPSHKKTPRILSRLNYQREKINSQKSQVSRGKDFFWGWEEVPRDYRKPKKAHGANKPEGPPGDCRTKNPAEAIYDFEAAAQNPQYSSSAHGGENIRSQQWQKHSSSPPRPSQAGGQLPPTGSVQLPPQHKFFFSHTF